MKRVVIATASVLGLLASGVIVYQLGDPTTKIGQLKLHPEEYNEKVVKVHGTVIGGVSVSGFGGYLLEDDTDKVLVKASVVPAKGATVTARGRVHVLLQTPLGDIIVIDTTATQ